MASQQLQLRDNRLAPPRSIPWSVSSRDTAHVADTSTTTLAVLEAATSEVVPPGCEVVEDWSTILPTAKQGKNAVDFFNFISGLNFDPIKEPEIMWIAEEVAQMPLPPGWSEHRSQEGTYYHHVSMVESMWQHPNDEFFHEMVDIFRGVQEVGGFWLVDDELEGLEGKVRAELREWIELFDDKGAHFYHNKVSKESRLDDPRDSLYHRLYNKIRMVAKMKEKMPRLARAPRPEEFSFAELEMQRRRDEERAAYLAKVVKIQCFFRVCLARKRVRQMRAMRMVSKGSQPLKGMVKLTIEGRGKQRRKELRLATTLEHKRARAALRIQTAWRGYDTRKQVRPLLLHRRFLSKQVTKIQRAVRLWLAAKREKRAFEQQQQESAVDIQRVWRGRQHRAHVDAMKKRRQDYLQAMTASTKIQALIRRFLARCRVHRLRAKRRTDALARVKAACQVMAARQEVTRLRRKAQPVQAKFTILPKAEAEASMLPGTFRLLMEPVTEDGDLLPQPHGVIDLFGKAAQHAAQDIAAAKVQKVARGHAVRTRRDRAQQAALEIISGAADAAVTQAHRRRAAATRIQALARRYLVRCQNPLEERRRKRLERIKLSVVKVQAHCRRYIAQEEIRRERAAVVIQAAARRWLARRRVQRLKSEAKLSENQRADGKGGEEGGLKQVLNDMNEQVSTCVDRYFEADPGIAKLDEKMQALLELKTPEEVRQEQEVANRPMAKPDAIQGLPLERAAADAEAGGVASHQDLGAIGRTRSGSPRLGDMVSPSSPVAGGPRKQRRASAQADGASRPRSRAPEEPSQAVSTPSQRPKTAPAGESSHKAVMHPRQRPLTADARDAASVQVRMSQWSQPLPHLEDPEAVLPSQVEPHDGVDHPVSQVAQQQQQQQQQQPQQQEQEPLSPQAQELERQRRLWEQEQERQRRQWEQEQERQRREWEQEQERQRQQQEQELQRQRELEEERQRQRELEQQQQLERQRELEIELQRQRELEQELQLQRQREQEVEQQRQRELEQELQRQREQQEQELQRQREEWEQEQQRQRELELEQQRQRELELEQQRQRELELEQQRQRELELEQQRQRELELEQQRQRELELEQQRQRELEQQQELEEQQRLKEQLEAQPQPPHQAEPEEAAGGDEALAPAASLREAAVEAAAGQQLQQPQPSQGNLSMQAQPTLSERRAQSAASGSTQHHIEPAEEEVGTSQPTVALVARIPGHALPLVREASTAPAQVSPTASAPPRQAISVAAAVVPDPSQQAQAQGQPPKRVSAPSSSVDAAMALLNSFSVGKEEPQADPAAAVEAAEPPVAPKEEPTSGTDAGQANRPGSMDKLRPKQQEVPPGSPAQKGRLLLLEEMLGSHLSHADESAALVPIVVASRRQQHLAEGRQPLAAQQLQPIAAAASEDRGRTDSVEKSAPRPTGGSNAAASKPSKRHLQAGSKRRGASGGAIRGSRAPSSKEASPGPAGEAATEPMRNTFPGKSPSPQRTQQSQAPGRANSSASQHRRIRGVKPPVTGALSVLNNARVEIEAMSVTVSTKASIASSPTLTGLSTRISQDSMASQKAWEGSTRQHEAFAGENNEMQRWQQRNKQQKMQELKWLVKADKRLPGAYHQDARPSGGRWSTGQQPTRLLHRHVHHHVHCYDSSEELPPIHSTAAAGGLPGKGHRPMQKSATDTDIWPHQPEDEFDENRFPHAQSLLKSVSAPKMFNPEGGISHPLEGPGRRGLDVDSNEVAFRQYRPSLLAQKGLSLRLSC